MGVHFNHEAAARAGLTDGDMLRLAGVPTRDDVIREWRANLPKPATPTPKVLYTATEVDRIVARHPELFGQKPAS